MFSKITTKQPNKQNPKKSQTNKKERSEFYFQIYNFYKLNFVSTG